MRHTIYTMTADPADDDQYDDVPLRRRFEITAEWENWLTREEGRWRQAFAYYSAGSMLHEALGNMGLWHLEEAKKFEAQVQQRDKTITEKDQIITAGRRENADILRERDKLEHDNRALRRELDTWKEQAKAPWRGLRGRFR